MAGFVKSFGCSFEYALYEISYANLILYNAVLPSYHSKKGKGESKGTGTKEHPINASDPKNKELIKGILQGYIF